MIWGLSIAVGMNSVAILVLAIRLNRVAKRRSQRVIMARGNGSKPAGIDKG